MKKRAIELIDRNEILRKIEPWLYSEGRGESEINMLRAVIAELKSLPAAPRWVRCEDAKPKERDYYFAFIADAEAFVGEYISSVDQWWNGDDLILTVTHWMPIEPPKEDA